MRYSFFLTIAMVLFSFRVVAQTRSIIGIDEHLGGQMPLGVEVINEQGEKIALRDVITKPTMLVFVYYECPGLCTPLMSEIAAEVPNLGLKPGDDYRIVSISFDPSDTYQLAAGKKRNYLNAIKMPFPEEAWSFLIADSAAIIQLTDAAGYRYKREGDEFIHAGALIMLSPEGKITRYLLGIDFLPFDMKMALIEAQAGRTSPTIAKMLKYCFRYDPEGRKYTLNITRVAGSVIILCAALFAGALVFQRRKKNNDKMPKGFIHHDQ